MIYRRMGQSGLKLSVLSLGSWFFGEQSEEVRVKDLIHSAYDQGVNFIDTADKYGKGMSEVLIGKAIKDLPREALVIATKVWAPMAPGPNGHGLSRKHIMEACAASLRRLDLDYVDIYFCHTTDPEVTWEEVVRAMDDLVHQGKVLYWGTSNWPASEISDAYHIAQQGGFCRPCVEESEYSMLVRDKVEGKLSTTTQDLGMGLVSYGPLRSGQLTGKYNDGIPSGTRYEYREWLRPILTNEDSLAKVRKLDLIAKELGVPLSQLAIAWLLKKPWLTSVITGASEVRQIKENLGALEVVEKLVPEVMEQIDQIVS
jgi:voltage-dependent potassium channel beta subunit